MYSEYLPTVWLQIYGENSMVNLPFPFGAYGIRMCGAHGWHPSSRNTDPGSVLQHQWPDLIPVRGTQRFLGDCILGTEKLREVNESAVYFFYHRDPYLKPQLVGIYKG